MRSKLVPFATVILAAFTLGAILGRRWKGDLADTILTFVLLATIALGLWMAFAPVRRRIARVLEQHPASQETQAVISHRHWTLLRKPDKYVLRVSHLGRLEFLEFSLALPGRDEVGKVLSPDRWSALAGGEKLALILFALSVLVYAITRLVALDKFPIYFFADEAIEGVLAKQLIARGLHDYQNHLLPVFFNTYGFFNPLISVYFHAITVALFGQSVVVTRATSAVLTVLASTGVSLILKFGLKSRHWWLGVLILAATPAWFLHSRTAFETATMVSLYAGFLLMYVLYRYRSPNFIFPALILAGATFYSYGNGQLVIGATGLLLLISDLKYHLKNWRTNIGALGLLVLLAVPYLLFQFDHPTEAVYHLRTLDSYIFRATPVEAKIGEFVRAYAYGLSPQYWFVSNTQDLARHRMKDYGHIALWMLPLFLVGVGVCIRQIKSSAHRLVLIAALAAPIGGALTQIAVTRDLVFVVPAAIFTALGLEFILERLRGTALKSLAAVLVFAGMAYASLGMLNDALTNGPLWFKDYGLYGMQWGAEQLFDIIPEYLKQSRDTMVNITPTWANGTDVFLEYFMPDQPRVTFRNVDALLAEKQPLDSNMIYVMTPEELGRARASKKFKDISIDRVLAYPDGTDGFYFARLAYVDNVEEIFADEAAERQRPVVEQIQLDGQTITVSHSLFDSGQLANLFDNDTFTLARVMEANPAILEFTFPTPRHVNAIAADFGTMDFTLTVSLYATLDSEPVTLIQPYANLPPDPHVEMNLEGAPPLVSKVRIEIRGASPGGMFKIHIRELKFK